MISLNCYGYYLWSPISIKYSVDSLRCNLFHELLGILLYFKDDFICFVVVLNKNYYIFATLFYNAVNTDIVQLHVSVETLNPNNTIIIESRSTMKYYEI